MRQSLGVGVHGVRAVSGKESGAGRSIERQTWAHSDVFLENGQAKSKNHGLQSYSAP